MQKIEMLTIRLRKSLLELSSLDVNVRRGRMHKSSILTRIVQGFFVSYSFHIVLPLYTSGGV